MAQKFAVFDIDGTVIRWQLYHAVVGELVRRGALDAAAGEKIRQARKTWKRRAHSESFLAYETVLVDSYISALKNLKVEDYLAAVDAVFEKYKDQVYTYTRDLIEQLKAEDYLLFAVTASQREVVEKLAGNYGFDDFVAAEFEQKDGKFTGVYESPFHDKAGALKQLMDRHGVTAAGSIGIGDSGSDVQMLELVEKPIAFNPNQGLFKEAEKQGWKVVIERKNMVYTLERRNGSYVLAETNAG